MFRFKQFTVHQDKCAMKVCTDACLFGAWVAEKLSKADIKADHILDIGTGTGLLSLMLAQSSIAQIDAVEIDADASRQAKENFSGSDWKDRLHLHHRSVNELSVSKKYDLIISNPPFYEKQLKSTDEKRNLAMHATDLSFEELATAIRMHISDKGKAAVLLPYDRSDDLKKACEQKGLFIDEKLNVSHSTAHPFFRSFLMLSLSENIAAKESNISIKDSTGAYSEDFAALLKDFYLAF